MKHELRIYLCAFLTFVVVIVSIFIVFSNKDSEGVVAANYRFVKLLDEGQYEVIMDTNTRVMYLQSLKGCGKQGYGGLTVLIDSEGKPLLYKGDL